MKRALLKSFNLIGDGLYVGPVAKEWYRLHGSEYDEVHMWVIQNHSASLYEGMGVPWTVVFDANPEQYDTFIDFDVSKAFQISDIKKVHLVQAYAEIAGIKGHEIPPVPNYEPPEMDVPEDMKNLVMVSAFSMSCASRENPPKPPNKMLPWVKWKPLLRTLREQYPNSRLVFLGAKEDRIPGPEEESAIGKGFATDDTDYLTGIPMWELANYMKYAKCVITLDNGMGHLAAAMQANLFYMASVSLSLHYIVPWGNPHIYVWHLDPVNVSPAALNYGLRSAIRRWKQDEGTWPR